MPYTASIQDLRVALADVRKSYRDLVRPRRWQTAFLLAGLKRKGVIPQWTSWHLPPPPGRRFKMTSETTQLVRDLFEVPALAVMRNNPGGVLARLAETDAMTQIPERILIDPFYAPPGSTIDGLCVVAGKWVLEVPFNDPSWLWSADAAGIWRGADLKEYKIQGNFGQQQGVHCAWPAEELFALGPVAAKVQIHTERRQCPNWGVSLGRVPGGPLPNCQLNNEQCAAKNARQPGPGGPRAVVPTANGGRILVPGAIPMMVTAANPEGVPLPPAKALELITSWCHQGGGARLSSARLYSLIGSADLKQLTA